MSTALKKILLRMVFASAFAVSSSMSTSASDEELLNAAELREAFLGSSIGVDQLTVGAIPKENEVNKYCVNIFNHAKEARHAVLMQRLKDMQATVDDKLDQMDKRIDELKTWTEKREKFLARANDSLVQIFQIMRPDAAAGQLTEMGPVMSAAIIARLEPKFSGPILAEMEPAVAAKVTMVLTDAVAVDDKS